MGLGVFLMGRAEDRAGDFKEEALDLDLGLLIKGGVGVGVGLI